MVTRGTGPCATSSSVAAGAARAAGATGQVATHARGLQEERSSAFAMCREEGKTVS